ncbi:GNAT family N-acetyltransferase [candidate division KSB1 bacterium]|nr:GNAT family N-acetyltransferase [candidate division KSB1 bacterium]
MELTIERYTPEQRDTWDTFVWQANNGTIFHTRQFLSYHPEGRFEDNSLIFKKDDRIVAVMPATIRHEEHRKILTSHRGASYGGFVTHFYLGIRDAFRLVEILEEYAVDSGFKGIDLTPPPQIYFGRPSNYIDFALMKSGFGYKKREISSVIPLTFGEDDVLNTFIPESRRAVRRAVKLGVTIQESDDYATFYGILKRNLKMRHNVQPTHSLNELLLLKQLFPERIRLFAAMADDNMVAGVVMFDCNERVTLAFYISHNEDFQQYRGVNYLFYEIIRWSIRQGFGYLDYGIFTVNMDPNWGLGRFKESFGAQGVFRDTWMKLWD